MRSALSRAYRYPRQQIGAHVVERGDDAQSDGKIEARSFLLHVRGREVDRDAAHRRLESGIHQRGPDAVGALLHRASGNPTVTILGPISPLTYINGKKLP